jgi:adenylate cyclase
MPAATDSERRYERAGLLEGTEGQERTARIDLLERLEHQGATVEDLKKAVDEDRLVLMPAQMVLAGEARYTFAEVAEQAGIDPELLRSFRGAFGLPREVGEGPMADDEALETARTLQRFLDAGVPPDDLLAASRVLGGAAERSADAILGLVGGHLLQPGDTERDLGLRYAEAAEELLPLAGPLHQFMLRLHLLERLRYEALGQAERSSGELPGARPTSVAFADLVGFTKLGERLPVDELSRVAGRLEELASGAAESPVRLVKTLGDGVLLSAREPAPLLGALFQLLEAVEAEDEDFPQLTIGVSHGPVLARAGDLYGGTVNLASRVGEVARPGTILATSEVRDEAGDHGYHFSSIKARRFKGLKDKVDLFRVRREREDRRERSDSDSDSGSDESSDRADATRSPQEARRTAESAARKVLPNASARSS